MFRSSILALCLFVYCPPSFGLSVGDSLPPPPETDVTERHVATRQWLDRDLVFWHLFSDAYAPDAATLEAVNRGEGFRYVALPTSGGFRGSGVTTLSGVAQWRPSLRHDTSLPLGIMTRPGGTVVAIYDPESLTGAGLLRVACALHLQRGDHAAALSIADGGRGPGTDPIRHLLAGRAALGLGQYARARTEAHGLGALDLHPDIRGAATALEGETAWVEGDLDAAEAVLQSPQSTPAAGLLGARLALARGDMSKAARLLQGVSASEPLHLFEWERALFQGHVALLRNQEKEVRVHAREATKMGPASWRAWQLQGLVELHERNEAGAATLAFAADLAPDGFGADTLAQAAQELFMMRIAVVPRVLVAVDESSVPHDMWPAAGPTAGVLLAQALNDRGKGPVDHYGTSQRAWSANHPFGRPVDPKRALSLAQEGGSDYLVFLTVHVGERGVYLNVRLADTKAGGFRGLESAVWTSEQTLEQVTEVLAARVAERLDTWNR